MPSEVICPSCGRALRVETRDETPEPDGPPAAARTIEVLIPGTVTSLDDFEVRSVSLASPPPDAAMSSFVFGDVGPPELNLQPSSSDQPNGRHATAPTDPFAKLKLESTLAPRPAHSQEQVHENEGRRSWPMILLASYASAMTIACSLLVLNGRTRGWVEVRDTLPTDSRPDLEQHPEGAPKVLPVAPVAEDHLTSIGQTLRLGSLEFTPVSIEVGRVALEHLPASSRAARSDGGSDALLLSVRFHNLSQEAVFAPLEAAFVREPDRGLPDSFIECGNGERIEIYRLAMQSEWAIVGQSFPELKPGETAETLVVSTTDALAHAANPMTWRLRLRTGPERVEVVGVRFGVHEIVREGD